LNEDISGVISRFQEVGLIEKSSLSTHLDSILTKEELKDMLKELEQTTQGNKDELINRLIAIKGEKLWDAVSHEEIFQCSEKAAYLIKYFQDFVIIGNKSNDKNKKMIDWLLATVGIGIGSVSWNLLSSWLYDFCKDWDNDTNTESFSTSFHSFFIDDRDGKFYRTIKIDDTIWMAENMRYRIPHSMLNPSYPYNGDISNVSKYGYLYPRHCVQFASPKGWKIPSIEDWKVLFTTFGGYAAWNEGPSGRKKIYGNPKNAYESLIDGGDSGFDALLGGGYYCGGLGFHSLNYYGRYWANESYLKHGDKKMNMYVEFHDREVNVNDIWGNWAFSCRCIID
jgi:uncharacterized protein (TIGR02145 family)